MAWPKGKRRGPGKGRKKGSRNKRTKAVEAAIAASGLTPLEYMLEVLRNTRKSRSERMQAAVAAAPYVHQRLAATTITTPPGQPIEGKLALSADPELIGEYLARLEAIASDNAAHASSHRVGAAEVPEPEGGEGPVPD